MRISEVARRAGVLPTTIRFYESIGLLPSPHRVSGQRSYGTDVLDRLAIIRFGLQTGFSLKELKSLFLDFRSRLTRRKAAQTKLKELRNLRQRIKLMERLLARIRLCRCGTIQQIAERLMKSGALDKNVRRVTELKASANRLSEGRPSNAQIPLRRF